MARGPKSATGTVNISVLPSTQPPVGTSSTSTILEDNLLTLTAANFGFTDPHNIAPNGPYTLANVEITTLPSLAGTGTLTDGGSAVTAGQFISVADINANKLIYTPGSHTFGLNYGNFTFQVQSNGPVINGGVNVDQTPRTLEVDVTYVDHAPIMEIIA